MLNRSFTITKCKSIAVLPLKLRRFPDDKVVRPIFHIRVRADKHGKSEQTLRGIIRRKTKYIHYPRQVAEHVEQQHEIGKEEKTAADGQYYIEQAPLRDEVGNRLTDHTGNNGGVYHAHYFHSDAAEIEYRRERYQQHRRHEQRRAVNEVNRLEPVQKAVRREVEHVPDGKQYRAAYKMDIQNDVARHCERKPDEHHDGIFSVFRMRQESISEIDRAEDNEPSARNAL